ncbi:hypothetical protein SPRG_01819 [Saprolegnia parasitica CBS 223.65]|uniref:MYND-type domain-containing protein n=1 Tax=Saprolegnia parasitica (strain CBS 223.65) TaxID=695850 RepID=A0A067CXE4_SAPPC|nr:hypothetical protein SPRG_01819 [Saprolegnia parasitica CBS 223.65]KDO33940.1 hypothetical protein SPRG_01819 [Saprolegnia parasitica CBS 223.65]|eukprot:XP_012195574.1 hypothetical protein SPRG_01819 [Saprolegnia parasitica CBS 223.65]
MPSKKTAAKAEADPAKTLLINEKGELTGPFAHALKRIFQKYSEGTNALTSEQLNNFSKACNDGKGFTEQELNEIHMYFDCDENKGLTQRGFCDMYHTQTSAEPSETWKDLRKLGFMKHITGHECYACGKTATTSCARCISVRYCSKECQTEDWKAGHKRACKPKKFLAEN